MLFRRTCFACVIPLTLFAGCGGSARPASQSSTPTSDRPSSQSTPTVEVRAAATNWAHAFLTGTLDDISNAQFAGCAFPDSSTDVNRQVSDLYLSHVRDAIKRETGVAPGTITIRDVLVRKVTARSAEARVEFHLAKPIVEIDHWMTVELHDARWKVANCGADSDAGATSTTAPAVG